MRGYLVVLAVVVLTTAATTPLVRALAIRIGAVVAPDERRVHLRPTPTLGGIAMFLGFAAGMSVASRMGQFHPVFEGTSEPTGVLLALAVAFALPVVFAIWALFGLRNAEAAGI